MSFEPTLVIAAFILLIATLVRSAIGFGEALLAVPLLTLLMPVRVAVPLAVLVSITIALVVVLHDWRDVHWTSALKLIIPTLFGIPIGLTILRGLAENAVEGALGVVLVTFSLFAIRNHASIELKNDRFAWLFGFVAGILGGAYGVNGPPLAVYGALRRWSPIQFRATLQAYFLPASMAGMTGYWLGGLWSSEVTRLYFVSLPGVLVAIFAGRFLNRRINAQRFALYLHVVLIGLGVLLVASIVR